MKRRDFFKTCAAGIAAGPLALVALSNAGYAMDMKYLTVGWRDLVFESEQMLIAYPEDFGRYVQRARAMQYVMRGYHIKARETGRLLRVTIPHRIMEANGMSIGSSVIPSSLKYMSDRIDVIHDSGYIETIKNRAEPEHGIGGRVV